MSNRTRKITYIILFVFFNLLLIEILSLTCLKYLHKYGVFYTFSNVSKKDYLDYLQDRDEKLGWPGNKRLAETSYTPYGKIIFDKSGSRIIPAYPDPDKYQSCVSLYGDSFTWGSEVDANQAWSNVLSKLLKCRVANYGVWGYGTDQAYLRFHYNNDDHAKIVILGFLTENILRNVNRYRELVFPTDPFTFKPRFIMDQQGNLALLPLPNLTYEQFVALMHSPEQHLDHEYFLPGGPSGIFSIKFPYTYTLVNGLLHNFQIRTKVLGVPHVAEFYQDHHPSQALPLTVAILEKFSTEALARQKQPLVLIIPTGPELLYYRKHGEFSYHNLVKKLKERQIAFLDAGPPIMKFLHGENPDKLFTHISRHFNSAGNTLLAEIVFAYLKSHGWLHLIGRAASP